MQAKDPFIIAAMDGQEQLKDVSTDSRRPREEPATFFYIIFGLVYEALAAASTDSPSQFDRASSFTHCFSASSQIPRATRIRRQGYLGTHDFWRIYQRLLSVGDDGACTHSNTFNRSNDCLFGQSRVKVEPFGIAIVLFVADWHYLNQCIWDHVLKLTPVTLPKNMCSYLTTFDFSLKWSSDS